MGNALLTGSSLWEQVQRLGSDVQQLEAESQRLLSPTEAGQPNGRSEASSAGPGQGSGQAVHSLELLDFSPNWDFTLGGSKVTSYLSRCNKRTILTTADLLGGPWALLPLSAHAL